MNRNQQGGGAERYQIVALLAGFALSLSTVFVAPSTTLAEDLAAIEVGEPVKLHVYPEQVVVRGPRAVQHLVVTGAYAAGEVQDLTRAATFEVTDAKIAKVENGVVLPQSDGQTEIRIRAGNAEVTLPVTVEAYSEPHPVSFQYGALPALSKQGCNSGACHGSPSGKGGFRLSLRAFDSALDQLTLIREDFGRRTNSLDPESSLLLLKPLMRVPHGGGVKLRTSDPAYAVLRDWIAEGCQPDERTPQCIGIEVYPPSGRVLHRPAHTQQLSVIAKFSDGTQRDVTSLSVFTSSDTEVADVNAGGLVIGADRGEAAIVVRYLEFIESTFITFVKNVDGYQWSNPPANNYIDELTYAKLKQLQYLPSELSTDAEFLRRVYLDVVGLLPTVEQTERFLADTTPDKRSKLIDALLDRPEFAKFWTLKWGDLLRMTSGQVGSEGVHKYHRWVRRAVETNMPYDQFARELLTAAGSTLENPAANFYRTATDTNDCVETISQVFLGARLQCAKCHNHPFERWTQDNYYGMAAFFNRVQRQKTPRPNEIFIWASQSGDVKQPRTGQLMKPWLPGAGVVEKIESPDRRDTFADWLTSPDNPYFARIEANRIWSYLLGRGIVDPPDDFRESNPPSNAALLDALAEDFVKHGFDRKHLIRQILNSRTYQASFRPNAFNEDDAKYFSHYQPRLLAAEQLLDAICHVTEIPEAFSSLPAGTKATQLPAPDLVNHEFLKIFGQPERQTVCQCERSDDSNLGMAIQFFNGPLIYNKVRDAKNRFRKLLAAGADDGQIVSQLHLAAVARPPTDSELQASLAHIAAKAKEMVVENQRIDEEVAQLQMQQANMRIAVRDALIAKKSEAAPEQIRADLVAAAKTDAAKRNEVQKYLVEKLGALVAVKAEEVDAGLSEEQKKMLAEAAAKATELQKKKSTAETSRLVALEDICWALLNTNEFLFNH